MNESFTISIVFHSLQSNGLLLFNSLSTNSFRDYVSLAIVDSYVVYSFDLGTGSASIISQNPITVSEWHTVTISRNGRQGFLTVDDQNVVNGTSEGNYIHLNLGDVMWLGGYRHFVNISAFTGVDNGFNGCIRYFQVNGVALDLVMEAESGLGIGECNNTICEGNPCLNGGTCVSSGNSFVCECPSSHMGELCAADVDHCSPNLCLNGGSCVEHLNGTGFSCLCVFGYEGEICSQGRYEIHCLHTYAIQTIIVAVL